MQFFGVRFHFLRFVNMLLISISYHQVERLPILIDSPKKLDHQLSSDPDKTPGSNAANSDSEADDISHPGQTKHLKTYKHIKHIDWDYATTKVLMKPWMHWSVSLFMLFVELWNYNITVRMANFITTDTPSCCYTQFLHGSVSLHQTA